MTRLLVIITVASAILFTIVPEIDLALTRVFFENNGFWASTSTPLNQFRDILYGAVFAMLVTALVSWGFALCGRRLWSVPTRVWAFVSVGAQIVCIFRLDWPAGKDPLVPGDIFETTLHGIFRSLWITQPTQSLNAFAVWEEMTFPYK